MSELPSITLSSKDVSRLEALLERLPAPTPASEVLERELVRAEVVEPDQMPEGVVTMRSTVLCRDDATGKTRELTLVYPHEAVGEGKVSVLAAAGAALLGLTIGQKISWPGPGGRPLTLTLLEVRYQPEAAGDYER